MPYGMRITARSPARWRRRTTAFAGSGGAASASACARGPAGRGPARTSARRPRYLA